MEFQKIPVLFLCINCPGFCKKRTKKDTKGHSPCTGKFNLIYCQKEGVSWVEGSVEGMELFNEKRVSFGQELEKEDGALAQKRFAFLEAQMRELKQNCIKLYAHHSYPKRREDYEEDCEDDYEAILKNVRKSYSQIQQTSWNQNQEELEIFKAKAGYFIGTVYKEKGAYDNALEYLKEAREVIERQTLQGVIPEFYIGICMGMAKCYMEKHSPVEQIEECHKIAEETLKSAREGIKTAYSRFFLIKLTLELKLQQAIAELDIYGQKAICEDRNVWTYLQEAEREYVKIPVLEDKLCRQNDFPYSGWKKKQEDTLQTTKGEFFKKLYFETDEKKETLEDEHLNYITDCLKTEIQARAEEGEHGQLYYEHFQGILADLNKIKCRQCQDWYMQLRNRCFETAFFLFAEEVAADDHNTICLGNMAVLLYDYKNKTDFDERYLAGVIRRCCKDLGNICISEHEDIEKNIKTLLNKIISIERSNMFALNIMSAMEYARTEPGRPSEIEHYPALRQSFLKKRFTSMYDSIYYGNPEEAEKEEWKEQLKKIEILLIHMHSEVTNFMNAAIIDFDSEGWKDLEVGHYTRLEVLPKLVNREGTGKMRIQNVHHLNDPTEGLLLIERLKKGFALKQPPDTLSSAVFQKYDSDKRGTVRNSVYMGSFSSRLDQLNMWTRYGDSGKGCSIQIDGAEFFDRQARISLAEASTDENFEWYRMEDIKYPLYAVLYLPDDPEKDLQEIKNYAENRAEVSRKRKEGCCQNEANWWKMQADLIDRLAYLQEELKCCFDEIQNVFNQMDKKNQDSIQTELCNTIMVILDLIRFLIKSTNYQDEREFRIIQYESDPEYDRDSKGIPKLYTEVKKELAYKKIYFGPLVQEFDSLAAYVLNIKKDSGDGKKKKTWGIEVCKSKIQYR